MGTLSNRVETVATRHETEEEVSVVDHEDERHVIRNVQIATVPAPNQSNCPPKIVAWILGDVLGFVLARDQLKEYAEKTSKDFIKKHKSAYDSSVMAMWASIVLGVMLALVYACTTPRTTPLSCVNLLEGSTMASFGYSVYFSQLMLVYVTASILHVAKSEGGNEAAARKRQAANGKSIAC
ncbi:hypothetical protein Tco_0841718 [Tanacetum coccineum]|uniref:Uncharacterized protein n=1 Tax=Tanacetum coccineum TaxID=301880 RepID=A0ABQ5AY68_9ASTR